MDPPRSPCFPHPHRAKRLCPCHLCVGATGRGRTWTTTSYMLNGPTTCRIHFPRLSPPTRRGVMRLDPSGRLKRLARRGTNGATLAATAKSNLHLGLRPSIHRTTARTSSRHRAAVLPFHNAQMDQHNRPISHNYKGLCTTAVYCLRKQRHIHRPACLQTQTLVRPCPMGLWACHNMHKHKWCPLIVAIYRLKQ
jgi:hypothetical protein